MSDIKLAVEYCTCCLLPADQCKHGQPIYTYEVDLPEDVREDASRMAVASKGKC